MNGRFSRIFGITALALRAALRTKTVLALLALLIACTIGLPLLIKGDGTPQGELQILLSYTLSFSFGLLALATLWSACSLFAAEIDSNRIQLTMVKPVRPWELWLGKWFALLLLNALLLAAVYVGVYLQIQWRISRQHWEAIEHPTSQFVTHPILPTPAEEAKTVYAQLSQQGQLPTNLTQRAILRALEEKARERYSILNPGEQEKWKFTLNRPIRIGDPLTVRMRFDTEFSTRAHVQGICRLSTDDAPGKAVEVPLNDFTLNEIEFMVNTEAFAISENQENKLSNFNLSFHYQTPHKNASAIMLRFRQDVVLLTPGGTFEGNLARSALIHWCVLGLLSAFGLTLSACFSLPVAAFTATILMILCMVGNTVVEVIAEEDTKDWKNLPGIYVSRAIHAATQAALHASPLDSVTHNERIEPRLILETSLWDLLVLPGFFLLLAHLVLSHRELADSDS